MQSTNEGENNLRPLKKRLKNPLTGKRFGILTVGRTTACDDCNTMKLDMSTTEFLEHIQRIHDHQKKINQRKHMGKGEITSSEHSMAAAK